MAENQLVPVTKLDPVKIFVQKDVAWIKKTITDGVNKMLEGATLETESGRGKYRSAAYQIARSKTLFDKIGKDFTAEQTADLRKKLETTKSNIKEIVDWCEEEQAKTRKPLTDWEAAEKERINNHLANIDKIEKLGNHNNVDGTPLNVGMLRAKLVELESIEIGESFEEYAGAAEAAWSASHEKLCQHIKSREQYEAEQAELERFRKEAAEREARERDERIAREAADKARKEAEEKAAREKADFERREQEARDAVAKAVVDRIKAEERALIDADIARKKAEKEKKDAIMAAEQKARDEAIAAENERRLFEAQEKAKAERLAANKAHRTKIQREAIEGFEKILGTDRIICCSIFEAIDKGLIPHTIIKY